MSPLRTLGMSGPISSFTRRLGGAAATNWEIIMAAGQKGLVSEDGGQQKFGYTGTSSFRSITASSTGASGRTSFGDGTGLYDAFFTKQNITKVALVENLGGGTLSNGPTSFSRYLVYDLVASTGAQSLYTIIYNLDQYNLNNTSWAGNDTLFGSNSVTNFVAGSATSGTLVSDSGHFKAKGGNAPSNFCIWGVNRDSDNDTQVLCAYSGNLTSGKGDAWRNNDPAETFWSYWGNDWHSNTVSQTISAGKQTDPGYNTSASGVSSGPIYLLAYTA